jgi:Tol biopolymer transport system component
MVSPTDEHTVAVDRLDLETGRSNIWLIRGVDGLASRFTLEPSDGWLPLWSRDGRRLTFFVSRGLTPGLHERSVDDLGADELLVPGNGPLYPSDWSTDSSVLFYGIRGTATKWDLWQAPILNKRVPAALLQTTANEIPARVSPNGHWLAYTSDESGRKEVYVQPWPTLDRKWQVSTAGGDEPEWRRDAGELFYIATDGTLMTVAVAIGGSPVFSASSPHALFQTRAGAPPSPTRNRYSSNPDGRRFLVNTRVSADSARVLTVVLNWPATIGK